LRVEASGVKPWFISYYFLDGKESVYRFVSIDQLLDDFITEVERRVG
jgi:hypothetical protein